MILLLTGWHGHLVEHNFPTVSGDFLRRPWRREFWMKMSTNQCKCFISFSTTNKLTKSAQAQKKNKAQSHKKLANTKKKNQDPSIYSGLWTSIDWIFFLFFLVPANGLWYNALFFGFFGVCQKDRSHQTLAGTKRTKKKQSTVSQNIGRHQKKSKKQSISQNIGRHQKKQKKIQSMEVQSPE